MIEDIVAYIAIGFFFIAGCYFLYQLRKGVKLLNQYLAERNLLDKERNSSEGSKDK